MQLSKTYFNQRKIEQLVENRTVYTLHEAELNIYETHQLADKVELTFNHPVLASMLRGKKVMHLRDNSFDFFPGESVILPSGELMQIDFPEANLDNPTQCLALTLSYDKINQVVHYLNETQPKCEEKEEWKFTDYNFHFTNDIAVNQIIGRMIFLFTENHPSKDLFADFMLKELIVRLMQTEARHLLFRETNCNTTNSRLSYVIQFIKEQLHTPITIETLSKKACMSQTHFFRSFKNELGISPIDYLNHERVVFAKKLLSSTTKGIAEICYACGFNNISYFNKVFKKTTNLTPSEYRQKTMAKI
jgi:AraC family transcriptional regulator